LIKLSYALVNYSAGNPADGSNSQGMKQADGKDGGKVSLSLFTLKLSNYEEASLIMHRFNYLAGNPADGSKPQAKKLVISDEYFQRVTGALIMRLRQHEEAAVQGGHLNHHSLRLKPSETPEKLYMFNQISFWLNVYFIMLSGVHKDIFINFFVSNTRCVKC